MAAPLDREAFFQRLAEFQEGYVIGEVGGCRVWLQLLTALYLEDTAEGGRQPRLLLGEAFVAPSVTPRNALIIPWDQITAIHDDDASLTLRLNDGELRILSRHAVELAGEVISGQVHRQSMGDQTLDDGG